MKTVNSSLNSDAQNDRVNVDVDLVGSKAKALVRTKRERRLRVATVCLEKLFPFCYRCTFLKRCDRLHSVSFCYRSPFCFITVLRFVSFSACV